MKYCQLTIRRETCLDIKALISYLVGSTALVGTEHDHVGSRVGELLGVELLVLLEELHVGTTANKGVFGGQASVYSVQLAGADMTYSVA